ncbi:hypothetical protein LOK74_03265 [Brevibacillus humidisoli]|uniref:hypothetical protein n=1 Tax=Brevibacillus humidisoli TaxID=2895522 RepID=UPI001E4EE4D0|nr:hypothetical protein [Brevibacillus humidisoli]UFJ41566.1 hypothetical protein LOK74_03265 [Brevibacillus humidisoli]
MVSKKISVIGVLVLSLLAGCNQMETKQSAEADYLAVRDQFLSQQGYSFWGVTKQLAGNNATGSAVNFSGQVQGDDLFLNVKLPLPEQKRVNTLSLLTKEQQLYVKTGDNSSWRSVDDGDVSFQQELNNWNPIISFQQMEEMRTSVVPLRDFHQQDDLRAVRVLLDSSKLKQALAKQMKEQIDGGRIHTAHVPKLKVAMNLSNGEWRKGERGARIKAEENRQEIDNLIDNMELEAEYTLYYDTTTYLPTRMVMQIRSEYDLDGQRMQEYTEVDTHMRNYGQRYQLPEPSQASKQPDHSKSLTRPPENPSDTMINDPGR